MVEGLVEQPEGCLRSRQAPVHLQREARVQGLHDAVQPGPVGLAVVAGP